LDLHRPELFLVEVAGQDKGPHRAEGEGDDRVEHDTLLHGRIRWRTGTVEGGPENPEESGSNQRGDVRGAVRGL